jgi:hypothetical protein
LITSPRARVSGLSTGVALALSALLAGCVTYTQQELSSMSAADICELEYMQRPNLSPEGRQAIQNELKRRNDNCANHAAEVKKRYDDFMYGQMYKNDEP